MSVKEWALNLLKVDHVANALHDAKALIKPGDVFSYEFACYDIPEDIIYKLEELPNLSMYVLEPEHYFSKCPSVTLTWIKPIKGVHVLVQDRKKGLKF